MRRNIIILANSRKNNNRCIAGIDIQTGEWIRPCFEDGKNGIPWNIRKVNGKEPRLLDILSISLRKREGPHHNIQPENRSIFKGAWEKVGSINVEEIGRFIQKIGPIFHNTDRRICIDELKRLPKDEKKSLYLIQANVKFATEAGYRGRRRLNASFEYCGYLYQMPVTDYEFESTFSSYSTRQAECLLTISLGLPFDKDNCCYKFIAGVIELRRS